VTTQSGPAVGYQGEPGAFSEEAVLLLFGEARAEPRRTLRVVFGDLEAERLDYGVVPLENSQAGSINETYDLLASSSISIVGEAVVRVDHALVALPGTRLEEVRRVSSHPQALAQCEEFLSSLAVELVPVYDTAGAAKRIAERGLRDEAAVASARAARVYGLAVLAERIQTHPDNRTRFAAISRNPAPLGPPDRTSVLFAVRNEPGALYRSLRPFAERGLNLSKLESRPLGGEPWQYRFYLDVDAGRGDPALEEALGELEAETTWLKVLGSYARWREPPPLGGPERTGPPPGP
jgi:prephenate dehydratase